jgi:outer membrane lipase/esterase
MIVLVAFGSMKALAYDSIVVFGDSYNDVGNIYTATSHLYPPKPYYDGRFSNGPIWIEHIASDWGLPIKPSLLGGTDFATGGAQLLQSTVDQGLTIPSIEDQVAAYLIATKGKADPHALYVIEGGGNDILDTTTFSSKLGCDIATALFGIVETLQAAGAKSFLVPDMIDIGQLPAAAFGGPSFVKFASDTTIEVNKELGSKLDALSHHSSVEIIRVPVFSTFLAVANATTHFGFTNVVTPCTVLDGLTVVGECVDRDHHLWWDAEHPTEFGHAFFAVLVEGQVANH